MDSLVSAARTMLGDEDYDEVEGPGDGTDVDLGLDAPPTRNANGAVKKRRRGGRVGGIEAGSPQPKRRKGGNKTPTSLHPSTLLATPQRGGPPPHSHTLAMSSTPARDHQLSRTRSALDVLAETAQEQERRPPTDNTGSMRSSPEPRGSLRAARYSSPTDDMSETPKGKERASANPSRPPSASSASANFHVHSNPVQSHPDDGESEVSDDTEPEQARTPQRASLRSTQFYKPRKALHQYQFVPPSPTTPRTLSRTAPHTASPTSLNEELSRPERSATPLRSKAPQRATPAPLSSEDGPLNAPETSFPASQHPSASNSRDGSSSLRALSTDDLGAISLQAESREPTLSTGHAPPPSTSIQSSPESDAEGSADPDMNADGDTGLHASDDRKTGLAFIASLSAASPSSAHPLPNTADMTAPPDIHSGDDAR